MRYRSLRGIIACLIFAGGLALGACGGDDSARREVTWRASDRLANTDSHWWWEPVERICEEDSDCPSDERCQLMRLGTCPTCPRSEDHEICIPRNGDGTRASR